MSIEAFRLEVPETELAELRTRLDYVRWPDELPGVGWAYGVPLAYLQELVAYWRDVYDWRKAEARLNEWPQYTTTIDGANVHFAHIRSPEPNAIPLILTHGWPGSIVEFSEVAGPLSDPRAYGGEPADAFHLVIPGSSRCSADSAIHSGRVKEVAGWRSPSSTRSHNRRLITFDGHQSSVAINITGMVIGVG